MKIGSVNASVGDIALLNGSNGVLLIPSGGLFGMENSAFFKASLDEYVKQGGTLIVLSQQHGYEFSVLPMPDNKLVAGYGHSEIAQLPEAASHYLNRLTDFKKTYSVVVCEKVIFC